MYREFDKNDIGRNITLPNMEIVRFNDELDDDLLNILSNPNIPRVVDFLLDTTKDKATKMALTLAFNWPLNYSSIQKASSRGVLSAWISQLSMEPIITDREVLQVLVSYIRTKSRKSYNVGAWLANEIEQRLSRYDLSEFFISTGGGADRNWSPNRAGADGCCVNGNNDEILMYFRFGTTSGGSQNDRWRQMYTMAENNPNRLFLFIVEGVESFVQYKLIMEMLEVQNLPNAIWSNLYYLSQINFDEFSFMDGE